MNLKIDMKDVRGVCHNPDFRKEWCQMEFELQCAKRLQINSVRFWLEEKVWKENAVEYLSNIRKFISLCWKYEISVMPILWNGNFITDFIELDDEEWEEKKRYVKDVFDTLSGEEGILMWDIINEPMCNDYLGKAKPEEYEARYEVMKRYARTLCIIFRDIAPDVPITVGHEQVQHCTSTIDLVDVISFHEYNCTRKEINRSYETAMELSRCSGNKPVLNTETGCIGRANPYDIELEMCGQYQVGWYLFNLVCEGSWGDIHGLIYPDGTIRDPAVIAALYGFFRNRTAGRILPAPNRECHANIAIEKVKNILKVEEESQFVNKKVATEEILEAAEYCVNILEACELVPMYNLPSARIACWRTMKEEERNIQEIKQFAYDMAKLLQEKCLIM